jgi:serine/threonine protein kinase
MSHVTDPRSPELDSQAPAAQLGVYQLLERIGAGALGEVFRARDTVHGRTVAIKRVPSALTADAARLGLLSRTATSLSRFSHPGVAMLYECGVHEGELFVAQEFVPGQSITALLGGRPIHPRRAVDLAIEIADALAALHAERLTHGDLRPDNVIVTPKGHVKLIDAGLAAFTGGGAIRASAARKLGALPADSAAVVRYLAPEEASGEGADARSDLFSLGLLLHEMLTGDPAFARATADDTLLAVLSRSVPPPSARQPTIPARLDAVVARALSRALDKRYQLASALADDLRVVKALLDAGIAQQAIDPPASEAPRSRVWWMVLLLACGAAAIVWLLLTRR